MIVSDPTDPLFNCYVSYDDAAIMIGNMLYAPNWKKSNETEHKRALITATLNLDRYWEWYGEVTDVAQTHEWPRKNVQRHDRPLGTYFPDTTVPVVIQVAVVEYAESLLGSNTTTDQNTGLSALTVGPISMSFSSQDRKDPIPDSVRVMLDYYGKVRSNSKNGMVMVGRA